MTNPSDEFFIDSKYDVNFIATACPVPFHNYFLLKMPSMFCCDLELSVIKLTHNISVYKKNNS